MKWIPVSRPGASLSEYHLTEGSSTLAVLKYNPLQHSARVSAGDKQQVFFIERAGLGTTRMIVENEYGVRTGFYTAGDLSNQRGDVILQDTRFHFRLQANQFVIYRHGMISPVASCAVTLPAGQTIVSLECAALLLGLCWQISISQHINNTLTGARLKESNPAPVFVIN